jgi:hypothetical protein
MRLLAASPRIIAHLLVERLRVIDAFGAADEAAGGKEMGM